MATRLGSDDLLFLNAVRALGGEGLPESTIAERLGISTDELRERMMRIRCAFVSLTDLMGLATGERLAETSRPWEIVIEEQERTAA